MIPYNVLYLIADFLPTREELTQFITIITLAREDRKCFYLKTPQRRIRFALFDKYAYNFNAIEEMVENNYSIEAFSFCEHYEQKMHALSIACKTGNYELAKYFSEFKFMQCTYDIIGNAIKGGNMKIIEMLTKSKSEKSAGLYNACLTKNRYFMEYFANQKINYTVMLMPACLTGDIEFVREILSLGATDYDDGLSSAISIGNIEICKLMIEKGAFCEKYHIYKKAVKYNALNVILTFCDEHIQTSNNTQVAAQFCSIPTIDFLRLDTTDLDFIIGAIMNKNCIEIFKRYKIDVHENFHAICAHGPLRLIKYAVNEGVNDMKTLMSTAVSRDKYNVIKFFGKNYDYSIFLSRACEGYYQPRMRRFIFDHVNENTLCQHCEHYLFEHK